MKAASGRVLIADDEPHVRELLRDFLAGQGYEVSAVATGAQALDAVPTFQPDVILVDMLMPGLPGRDVLDALRRAGVTVPAILISGNPDIVGEGFFGVLRKPFNLTYGKWPSSWQPPRLMGGPPVPDENRRRLLLTAALGFLQLAHRSPHHLGAPALPGQVPGEPSSRRRHHEHPSSLSA